jgi:hypothetical protein
MVTNFLGAVANVLPSGKPRGRKTYPLDANGNKIRPEKENKETNFILITNSNLY